MNYRPEDWNKTKKRLCAVSLGEKRATCGTCPGDPMTCDTSAEKLVDAMLEGLKGDYLYRVDLVGAETTTDPFLAKLLGRKGFLVFIPEEQ